MSQLCLNICLAVGSLSSVTAFCSINNRTDSFLICISFIVLYGSQSYSWLAHDISQNWAHYVEITLGFEEGGYFIIFVLMNLWQVPDLIHYFTAAFIFWFNMRSIVKWAIWPQSNFLVDHALWSYNWIYKGWLWTCTAQNSDELYVFISWILAIVAIIWIAG